MEEAAFPDRRARSVAMFIEKRVIEASGGEGKQRKALCRGGRNFLYPWRVFCLV